MDGLDLDLDRLVAWLVGGEEINIRSIDIEHEITAYDKN